MKTILFSILSFFAFISSVHAQDSISVLWIGNSYTYVNDLPTMTSQLAASLGDEITFDSKTNGGYTFANQAADPLTYTKIKSKSWDYVILQAQSQEPSFPTSQVNSNTLPYAEQLADSVYANRYCSQVHYYMTWGRQNGDAQWDSINSFNKMNGRLRDAYLRFMDSTEASVSPVGSAWRYVRDNYPSINLYQADGSHPSVEGSYLAAATFYASLFRKSPVGATYISTLDQNTATILQEAAALTVMDSLSFFKLRSNSETAIAQFSIDQNNEVLQLWNESWRATNYEWDFGDGTSSTDEHPAHNYINPGTFFITLIASNECGADTLVQQVSVFTIGVEEQEMEYRIRSLGDGNYVISGPLAKARIELLSAEGNQLSKTVLIQQGNDVSINLSSFAKGIYYLKVDGKTLKLLR